MGDEKADEEKGINNTAIQVGSCFFYTGIHMVKVPYLDEGFPIRQKMMYPIGDSLR